jgi:hypothetical protein
MKIAELIRLENSHQYGALGVLKVQKEVFCVTLEPPVYDNMQNISCIPAGQYLATRTRSPKFGDTFEIRHVPNRSNVLFHAGNRVKDTEGCILLGQYFGKLQGDRAALNSGATFKSFLGAMKGEHTFSLTISESF